MIMDEVGNDGSHPLASLMEVIGLRHSFPASLPTEFGNE